MLILVQTGRICHSKEDMEFDTREVNRKLARIATPIAIQGVVSATLMMIDNIMVGFLGETELAAVGVGSQLFSVHYDRKEGVYYSGSDCCGEGHSAV